MLSIGNRNIRNSSINQEKCSIKNIFFKSNKKKLEETRDLEKKNNNASKT